LGNQQESIDLSNFLVGPKAFKKGICGVMFDSTSCITYFYE